MQSVQEAPRSRNKVDGIRYSANDLQNANGGIERALRAARSRKISAVNRVVAGWLARERAGRSSLPFSRSEPADKQTEKVASSRNFLCARPPLTSCARYLLISTSEPRWNVWSTLTRTYHLGTRARIPAEIVAKPKKVSLRYRKSASTFERSTSIYVCTYVVCFQFDDDRWAENMDTAWVFLFFNFPLYLNVSILYVRIMSIFQDFDKFIDNPVHRDVILLNGPFNLKLNLKQSRRVLTEFLLFFENCNPCHLIYYLFR